MTFSSGQFRVDIQKHKPQDFLHLIGNPAPDLAALLLHDQSVEDFRAAVQAAGFTTIAAVPLWPSAIVVVSSMYVQQGIIVGVDSKGNILAVYRIPVRTV